MSQIIYPTTNFKATRTLTIERGEGAYVYDNNGKQYLEALAGLWCTSLGYNNRELVDEQTVIFTYVWREDASGRNGSRYKAI